MYDLKMRRKRANPAERLYSNDMNSKLNSYLRTHPFPKSLFCFTEAIGLGDILPSASRKFVNLLAKNDFGVGDRWLVTLKSEVLNEEPTASVKLTEL